MHWLDLEACYTQKTHGQKRYVGGRAEKLINQTSGAISVSILRSRSDTKALLTFTFLVSLLTLRSLPIYQLYAKFGYVLPLFLSQRKSFSIAANVRHEKRIGQISMSFCRSIYPTITLDDIRKSHYCTFMKILK